jgi:hypothetical protein
MKLFIDYSESLKPNSNAASPRSQSPSSDRISPCNIGVDSIDSFSDKKTPVVKDVKMPAR